MAIEIAIILGLLLANGVFAMSELALVSARRTKLKRMADAGDEGAGMALQLAQEPTRFLSTIQAGITLVGVCAGAFGGATVAESIAVKLREMGFVEPYAKATGVLVVVLAISYLSLVVGELVPKRLALLNPEAIARQVAGPLNRLAVLLNPMVRVLGLSTDFVLRVLGARLTAQPRVTEEEIRILLEEGVQEGVFEVTERAMVESVLALDRLPVREIMTPRPKIIFLNRQDSHESVWHKIVVSGHSSFPVYDGNRDNVIGMVTVKAIYANVAAGLEVNLADLMMKPEVVPSTQTVSQLLDTFKKSGRHVAMVADEFGGIVGMATLVDVLEAIAGDFPTQEERLRPHALAREDGTWLVDGLMELEELEQILPALRFPKEPTRGFDTLAGFVVSRLGRVPQEGEILDWLGYQFEVIDMDRHRVDKILVTKLPGSNPEEGRVAP